MLSVINVHKEEFPFDNLRVTVSTKGGWSRSCGIVSAQPSSAALPCLNSVAQELNNLLVELLP